MDAEERELAGLRDQQKKSIAAQTELERIGRAREHHAAKAACDRLQAQLAQLPGALAQLRGDEKEQLDRSDATFREIEENKRNAALQANVARQTMSETGLASAGLDAQFVAELREWQREAVEHKTRLDTRGRERDQMAVKEQHMRRRLRAGLDPAALHRLHTVRVEPLSQFARQVDRVRARVAALKEYRRWLQPPDPNPAADLDEDCLDRGVAALHEWLCAPAPAAPATHRFAWPHGAAVALGVVGLMLALQVHLAWAWILLPAAALWGVGECRRRRPATNQAAAPPARAVYQDSYRATRLPGPDRWATEPVQTQLRALLRQQAALRLEQERRERRKALEEESAELDRQQETLAETRRAVARQVGLEDLELEEEWLPLFIETLGEWQQQADGLRVAEQAVAQEEQELRTRMDTLSATLVRYGYAPPSSTAGAGKCIDDLEQRRERHHRARTQMQDWRRRIRDEYEPELDRLAAERTRLLDGLGLRSAQESRLNEWIARLPEWNGLRKQLAEQQVLQADRAQALKGHEDWLACDPETLEQRQEQARALAARREELSEQIAKIEHDIDQAKCGGKLAEARAAEANARAELEAVRDRRSRAAAGTTLCRWLQSTAIERARPQVFKRAQELLLVFTRGALSLEVDGQSGAALFLAREGEGAWRRIGQLSAGERVQLLMAVRLAFLEQNETVRLPLLLDEALGASDDERAGAIIEAVKALALSGRQIFYFTAQHDEVGKWLAQLGEAVDHRVYDLAERRRLARPAAPLPIQSAPRPAVPEPDGSDYAAYGRRLGVPALDPRMETLDGVHVWHVLNDAPTLHRLLQNGIATWGQLRSLLAHGGAGLIDEADTTAVQGAAAMAEAIATAREAWRVGRGQPVDREILQDSGIVSARFIDPVSKLCAAVGGDANALLQKLGEGAVERWRKENTAKLADYLGAQGCLDEREPLTAADLRVRVLAAVSADIRSGRLALEQVDRALARFTS